MKTIILIGVLITAIFAAGCVTQGTVDESLPQFSEEDEERGWYYGARNQKKPGTPEHWKHKGKGSRSAMWYDPTRTASKAREEYCTKVNSTSSMGLTEAKQVAVASECEDRLKDTYMCNEYTGTWWIDLNMDMEGCNPACVVNVETKTAEINWRCTGALPPE